MSAASGCDVVVRKTPVLNAFISFLENHISEAKIDDADIGFAKSTIVDRHPDEKYLYHLALCAYLEEKEIRSIFRAERNEDLLFCLVDAIDEEDILTKEKYWDLVIGLGLLEDCLCMIVANPDLSIMKLTTTALTERFIKNIQLFSEEQIERFLTLLVYLSNVENVETGDFYLTCCLDFLKSVLNSSGVKDIGKLSMIFRLTAFTILDVKDVDGTDTNELVTLVLNWKLDCLTQLLISMQSVKIFKVLFDSKSCSLQKRKQTNLRVIEMLEKLVENARASLPEEDVMKREESKLSEMSWYNYTGACAYFCESAIKKYSVNMDAFPKLFEALHTWEINNPKVKEEDTINEVDFKEFCERMRNYDGQDMYKRDWMTKFFKFPPNEIFGTSEGLAVAEKFIIKDADYDLAKEFAGLAYTVENYQLNDDAKKLLLKIFIQNDGIMKRKNEFIRDVFAQGVGGKFRTSNFLMDLNTLGMQVSSIETEKDHLKLSKHDLAVTVISLQDPFVAISKLLEQSVRTQHFKALEFAFPFFNLLSIRRKNEELDLLDVQTKLIVSCFNNVMKRGDYQDVLFDCITKSLDVLISKNILTTEEIFIVLKYRILKVLKSDSVILPKIVGVLNVLEELVKFSVNELQILQTTPKNEVYLQNQTLLNDIYDFAIRLNRFFCLYTNSSTFAIAISIRETLLSIISLVSEVSDKKSKVTLSSDDLEDYGVLELGILYVRCNELRSDVENVFKEQNMAANLEYNNLLGYVLQWVVNSCETEWESLINFIFEVLLKYNAKYNQISKVSFLNEMLHAMYTTSVEISVSDAFLHVFKFYVATISHLKQLTFGDSDYTDLLDALIKLAFGMCKQGESEKKEKRQRHRQVEGLHQVLLYLMNLVMELVKTKREYMVTNCGSLMAKFEKIPHVEGTCEQSRIMIFQELTKLQNPSLA